MPMVCYNGIKALTSFSKACVEWTTLRGFKEEVRFLSGLYVHLHEARRLSEGPSKVLRPQLYPLVSSLTI